MLRHSLGRFETFAAHKVRFARFLPRVVSAFQGSSRCYRLFDVCVASSLRTCIGARNLCVVHVSSKWGSWSKEIVEAFPDSLVDFSLDVSSGSTFHTSFRAGHCTAYVGHGRVSTLKTACEPSPTGGGQICHEPSTIHPSVGRVIARDSA